MLYRGCAQITTRKKNNGRTCSMLTTTAGISRMTTMIPTVFSEKAIASLHAAFQCPTCDNICFQVSRTTLPSIWSTLQSGPSQKRLDCYTEFSTMARV